MTELKKYRRGTKNYYRLLQVPYDQLEDKNHHQCVGCAFDDLTNRELPSCPERKKDFLDCQDFIGGGIDLDPEIIDYIFVPATKAGLAAYVAHKLDYS